MHTKTTIIIGDSRRMEELKDESIHLVITSPPYWQLKDYGNGSQIGFNDSYEDYINNLNLVWKECFFAKRKFWRPLKWRSPVWILRSTIVFFHGRRPVAETNTLIIRHLKDLHLPAVRACFEAEADLARRNGLSFEQYLCKRSGKPTL